MCQDKTTPLFISAIGGHVDVVQALIEAGAEVDVECGDSAVTEVGSAEIGYVSCPNAPATPPVPTTSDALQRPVTESPLYLS